MKKRKRIPYGKPHKVTGFLFLRVIDLISLEEESINTKTVQQHRDEFNFRLQEYVRGKGVVPRRAAIKYLLEDCEREIGTVESNSKKSQVLQAVRDVLIDKTPE